MGIGTELIWGHLVNFRHLGLALAVACAATLAACGSGGDDDGDGATPSGTGPAARYTGTWLSNCQIDTNAENSSFKTKLVITQINSTQAKVVGSYIGYTTTANCTGTTANVPGWEEVDTVTGTKEVDGKVVDKITYKDSGGEYKYLSYTDGKTLLYADDDSTPDADGYPTHLDGSFVFTKQ
jgi:hypothetical protein